MRIGASDPSLTRCSGMAAVSELVEKLAVLGTLDEQIPAIKSRARGVSGGGLVLSVACAQLLGQDALVGLDRVRADTAGRALSPVAMPASMAAGSLARRFKAGQHAGIEAAVARLTARWLSVLPARRTRR